MQEARFVVVRGAEVLVIEVEGSAPLLPGLVEIEPWLQASGERHLALRRAHGGSSDRAREALHGL